MPQTWARARWACRVAPQYWKRYAADRKRRILFAPYRPHPEHWSDSGLYAAWLGHSTVLLKIDGVTVLTDPVFSARAGVGLGPVTVGLKRLVAPALDMGELPHIDLILLSHAHMDHFDRPSLRWLQDRGTTVITAAHTADLLHGRRYRRVTELGWGERTTAGPVELQAFPVNHWGARVRTDTYRGYNGYTLECGRFRVLFGGDTAATTSFRSLKKSRPFHLALMPIGAYDPWVHYHCTPEQAWQMADAAGAESFLPVHHQTFPLGSEPRLEPIERLRETAGKHHDRIAIEGIGGEFHAG